MLYTNSNSRNHSMFSKRGSDGHFRRFTQNVAPHLKLSNSKTLIELCHTDRSQSQVNQTSNNLLGYSQDNIQSPHPLQFHIKTYIRFKPSKFFQFIQPTGSNQMKKIAVIDKKKILCEDNFFSYDHVFEQLSTQKDIYNCVCKQMVQHFIRGFNSTIFAYGQTGSGKTYTMFGDIHADDQKIKGIVPQVIKDIYAMIYSNDNNKDSMKQYEKSQMVISCSMLEIYKESMIDLLSTEKLDLKIKQHQIFNVANLTIKQVNNQQQMYQVLKIGNQSKKIRQTNMNQASSRSHVIFTIYLQVKKQNQRRLSKFNLVDLAGSQKVSKSKVQGEGLEQAKKINLSLSCLGNTINALLKGNDHIPYRQSKLTRLLYESLGGNSLTRLIVTCSSEDTQIQETLSSLKFASRAKNLKTNPLINTLRKSQKSVSRIAYQNLKTNLHKAQNKLRKINILTDELKNQLSNNSKHLGQDKQNQSCLSNKDSNKYDLNMKNHSVFQQKIIDEFLSQITQIMAGHGKNKDSDMIIIQKTKNNDYLQTQAILNPFIMITENEQKHNLHQKTQQKLKSTLENHKKSSIPNLLQINSSKKQNQKYWQIIKQQQKQIQQLQKKLKQSQQKSLTTTQVYTVKKQPHQNHLISTQICKQIQSCQSSNFKTKLQQIIDEKESRKSSQKKSSNSKKKQNIEVKMTKKLLNIKLATNKGLPIREISLNSPTYKTSDFNKKFNIFNNSKSISRKNSDQNFFSQKVQSPREFNLVEVENNDKTLQNSLKQITKRLNHRNQYEKFEKRILLKQVQLMCEQKLQKNLKNEGKLINQSSIQDNKANEKKILKQQTNQLLALQSKYIDQLQNSLMSLKDKNILNIDDDQQKKQQQTKLKINAIKFR